MFIFWWSGRGYLTFLIVLSALAAFGLVQRASGAADGPWIWGSALLVAAAVNWHFGRKVNRKKLLALKPGGARDQLFYRARHRFMSLPMETFSLVIAVVGLTLLAAPLFHSGLNVR
ncbi:MAG TPA: hypothetical protein VK474_02025 [Chthoniobacterales bacterium]|nr:hypothetical protein [Chthoniobacterales bacterium]